MSFSGARWVCWRPLLLGAGLNVGLEVFFGLMALCVSGVMSRLI